MSIRRTLVAVVCAAALVCSAVPPSYPDRVDHASRGDPVHRPGEVGAVSEVAWEWATPEGRRLRRVLAGVSGALMVLDDGVVALAGDTGGELWHHRDPGRRVAEAAVTPDRETLLLFFADGGSRDVLAFSTGTGEAVGAYRADAEPEAEHLTDDLRISVRDDGAVTVTAHSLTGGGPVWSREMDPPAPGQDAFVPGDLASAPGAVVVTGTFTDGDEGHTAVVVALEPGTGRVLWERERGFTDHTAQTPSLTVSPDDAILMWELPYTDMDGRLLHWLLEPVTGAEVPGTFLHDRRRRRVAFGSDGYVDHVRDIDTDEVEYRYVGFDGTVRERITAPARPAESEIHPGWRLPDGVLRLHTRWGPGVTRGPVTAEILAWDGGARRIPVDLEVDGNGAGGERRTPGTRPVAVRVPGAVLITENTERWFGPCRVVALR